jgi:CBS domain containing-hemolysin-like protein
MIFSYAHPSLLTLLSAEIVTAFTLVVLGNFYRSYAKAMPMRLLRVRQPTVYLLRSFLWRGSVCGKDLAKAILNKNVSLGKNCQRSINRNFFSITRL